MRMLRCGNFVKSEGHESLLMCVVYLLCAFGGVVLGCHRSAPSLPPAAPLSWEQFEFELKCIEALGYGNDYSGYSLGCRQQAFEVIVEARRNASCETDADCTTISSWPPIGPCCLAANFKWSQKSYYRLNTVLISACGFIDTICREQCESMCIQGICRLVPDRPVALPPSATCSPQMVQAYFSDAGVRPYWGAPTVTPGDAGTGGSPDAGSIDAGLPDAGLPDAGLPDAGLRDAGQLEVAPRPPAPPGAAPTDGDQPD